MESPGNFIFKIKMKIYYVPGLLSLLLLPVLFIGFLKWSGKGKVYYVMPLISVNKEYAKKHPFLFPEGYPPKRKYEDINITGVAALDEIKLTYSQIRVREMLQQNNASQGIHYHFGDSATYGSFIKALNILHIEMAEQYLVDENDIWFLNVPRDTTPYKGIDCMLVWCVAEVPPRETYWEKLLIKMSEIWDSSWWLIIGFSLYLIAIWLIRRTPSIK